MKGIYAPLLIVFFLLSYGSMKAQQLDNSGEPDGTSANFGEVAPTIFNVRLAIPFTTGGSPYTSATVNFNFGSSGATGVAVDIFSESGGLPNASIATLSGPSSPSAGSNDYSGTVSLSASTNYFIVLSASGGTSNSIFNVTNGNINTADGFSAQNDYYTSSNLAAFTVVSNQRLKFTLTTAGAAPVTLISFDGDANPQFNELKWATSSELNNSGFEIQRSSNGNDWEIMDFINGHGTTQTTHQYSWIDFSPYERVTYYRLKQIDFDGAFEYSKIIALIPQSNARSAVFPNPVSGDYINYSLEENEDIQSIQLFNIDGKLMREVTLIDGRFPIKQLEAGMYLFVIKGKKVTNKQLVVLK